MPEDDWWHEPEPDPDRWYKVMAIVLPVLVVVIAAIVRFLWRL